MWLIVGRTALNRIFHFTRRTGDIDAVYSDSPPTLYPNYPGQIVETHKMPEEILSQFSSDDGTYADLDSLYTLKLSHAEYNIHWWKTAQDILFMKKMGAKIKPKLLVMLKQHWVKVHGNKEFLNLGRTSKDFFDDYVYKAYDHDWLHEVIAYPNPPAFKKCLKDGAEVDICNDKFLALSKAEKVQMLQEEILVIATERWLTNPHNDVTTYDRAYQLALQKTVTNLTKGIQSQFIVENLELFLKWPKSWKINLERHNVMKDETMKFPWVEQYTKDTGRDEDDLIEALTDDLTWADSANKKWLEAHGYEHLNQEGGGEGGAESCSLVFKLDGKFYKTSYSYYSYDGYSYDYFWDNMKEVHPKQKTVTIYE